MAIARLGSVSLDCDDPRRLAEFWAALLGGEIAFSSDAFVAIRTDHLWLSTVRVADFRPPTWPDGTNPKHMHLDLAVKDLESAQDAALMLGARVAAFQPSPALWRVMLDPAGHPFCLSTQIPD